jgi:HSP20 family protein
MLPMLFRREDRHPISSLRGELDRLFEDVLGDGFHVPSLPAAFGTKALVPAMDVTERADAYVAELELPGLKPEDFHVELQDGVLSIRGERKQEKEEKGRRFHRTERVHGSFERRIALPTAVDADQVAAAYEDGVLTVTVPKVAGPKPRRVEVQSK